MYLMTPVIDSVSSFFFLNKLFFGLFEKGVHLDRNGKTTKSQFGR